MSFGADVEWRVADVALDAFAVGDLRLDDVGLRGLDVGAETQPPPQRAAVEVDRRSALQVVPVDAAQDSRELDVAPLPAEPPFGGEIGPREAPDDVGKVYVVKDVG